MGAIWGLVSCPRTTNPVTSGPARPAAPQPPISLHVKRWGLCGYSQGFSTVEHLKTWPKPYLTYSSLFFSKYLTMASTKIANFNHNNQAKTKQMFQQFHYHLIKTQNVFLDKEIPLFLHIHLCECINLTSEAWWCRQKQELTLEWGSSFWRRCISSSGKFYLEKMRKCAVGTVHFKNCYLICSCIIFFHSFTLIMWYPCLVNAWLQINYNINFSDMELFRIICVDFTALTGRNL